jgi:hypothetical protein
MSQHRPTLAPAIFALFSLAASCAVSTGALHAAECNAKPDKPPPQGEHWYYRTDRATKRQCWYLGPEGASVQKGATQASEQLASDALAQPAAPQRAQRPTAASAATEPIVPAPAVPLPWPEASKLPDVPPPALRPTLIERPQSVDAIDPAPTSTSSSAEGSQSPANARSSPAAAPAKATEGADHTLALATIALAALVISGSVFHATRWLDRRRARNRHRLEWQYPSTLSAPSPRAPVDLDSETAARHIPPPPRPFDETKRLTQALHQILNELQTKHHVLQPGPSILPRSSRPPIAAATRSDLINNGVS